MLSALTIRDIVLIEQAALEFAPGLNVLTGETGAGKSILLDSLGLAAGGRGRATVRAGAAQGAATAVFDPPTKHPARALLKVGSERAKQLAAGNAPWNTKAGLLALTRAIAVDHAADGIRAVSLSPGALMTGRLTKRYGSEEAVTAALAARYPLGRIGTAEEAAEAAHFLISDAASFITGVDLLADGGYTAV